VSTSAAQAWLGEALRHHGEATDDGRMRIRRSQAALARDADCSAGTIAYYLHDLGDAVSFTRDGGLVVVPSAVTGRNELPRRRCRSGDVADALYRVFGQPPTDGWAQLVDMATGRAPTLRQMAIAAGIGPSTMQRHVERLLATSRLRRSGRHIWLRVGADGPGDAPDDVSDPPGHEHEPAPTAPIPGPGTSALVDVVNLLTVLAAVVQDLVHLGESLLVSVAGAGQAQRDAAIECAHGRGTPRSECAQPAGSRDCAHSIAHPVSSKSIEKSEDLLSSPSTDARPGARSARFSRGPDTPRPTTTREVVRSSTEEINAALAPLRRCCERLRLPAVVDEEGRRWLALYSPEELARAVTQVIRMAEVGQGRLRSPMGLLVQRAKEGEEALFEPAPERPAPAAISSDPPASPMDEEAAQAIAAMADDELARLDATLRARLVANQRGSSAGVDRIMGDATTLADLRRQHWRQMQSVTPDEAGGSG
jgi:hypothetical protein